jgi:hypothetical protein
MVPLSMVTAGGPSPKSKAPKVTKSSKNNKRKRRNFKTILASKIAKARIFAAKQAAPLPGPSPPSTLAPTAELLAEDPSPATDPEATESAASDIDTGGTECFASTPPSSPPSASLPDPGPAFASRKKKRKARFTKISKKVGRLRRAPPLAPLEDSTEKFAIAGATFYENDTHGDWFTIRWLGCPQKTFQTRANILDFMDFTPGSATRDEWEAFFDKVKAKGFKAKETERYGDASLLPPSAPSNGPLPLGMEPIRFRSTGHSCAPHAFGSCIGASLGMMQKLKLKAGAITGIADLSAAVNSAGKGIQLSQKHGVTSPASLLALSTGMYVIGSGAHCISADCSRRLLFCCEEEYTLPLSMDNLSAKGFASFDKVRLITVPATSRSFCRHFRVMDEALIAAL